MVTKADCSILRAVTRGHITSLHHNNKEPLVAITVLEVTNHVAGSSHMTVMIGKFTSPKAQMIVVIATVMTEEEIEGEAEGGGEGEDRIYIDTQREKDQQLKETLTHSTSDQRVMPPRGHHRGGLPLTPPRSHTGQNREF